MARKKKFAPNDNNLTIAYYRFSPHSQNEASIRPYPLPLRKVFTY